VKYLKEYNQFILEEVSKNEPIPEIIGKNRGLAVFLIGSPGIGKSYFVKNHIHTKNRNIKDFSTDDVSLLYTKDPNVYYTGRELTSGERTSNASEMNLKKMEKFMETGQSFIYDTTGAGKEFTDRGFEHIKEIFDKAREFNYEIVFIHLLSTLQTSIDQDKLRDRHVNPHYIQWAYAKQQGGEIDGQKVEGNIQRYKSLNPDAYYLVTSIDKKYKFYKFIDGKLAIRKNDRYIIKESIDNKSEISNIVDCML
jgi:predicted kinase